MTVLEHRRAETESLLASRAWVAAALAPAGWAVGGLAGLLSVGSAGSVLVSTLLGIVSLVVWVAPPTAAVVLGFAAVRAGDRSGRSAVVVAETLLVVTFLLMPLLGSGVVWVTCLVVVGTVLMLLRRRYPHRTN